MYLLRVKDCQGINTMSFLPLGVSQSEHQQDTQFDDVATAAEVEALQEMRKVRKWPVWGAAETQPLWADLKQSLLWAAD